jgi:hypothetical protein
MALCHIGLLWGNEKTNNNTIQFFTIAYMQSILRRQIIDIVIVGENWNILSIYQCEDPKKSIRMQPVFS